MGNHYYLTNYEPERTIDKKPASNEKRKRSLSKKKKTNESN